MDGKLLCNGQRAVMFALIWGSGLAHAQTILYVDQNATGPTHDGWTWCTAFTDLQDALDIAVFDVEIRVAQGTYTPDRGTGNRSDSFRLNIVALKGGYAGCGAVSPDERNITLYETILSGDIGAQGDNSDNSLHVVTSSGTNRTALFDGFTVVGGNADGGGTDNNGGGLLSIDGSATINNCTFLDNSANGRGGGMYNDRGSPVITNCTFDGNTAGNLGGGMFNSGSNPIVTDSTFVDNTANRGGGMGCYGGGNQEVMVMIRGCTFSGNSAEDSGGALHGDFGNFGGLTLTLSHCAFFANSAVNNGGALYSGSSTLLDLSNCIFTGNSANRGGGINGEPSSGLTMTNCTFSDNSATTEGRAIAWSSYQTAQLTSCILWGGAGAGMVAGTFSGITITFSNIQGGWPGGNIFAPPLFVDADGPDGIPGTEDDDLRLLPGSPSIDSGDPAFLPGLDETDLDGNPRVVNGRVDMGAYESDSTCSGDDFDNDGVPDMCDPDIDGDGVSNITDVCGSTPPGAPVDSNGRPIADLDEDCDTDLEDFQLFLLGFTGPGA